MGQARSERIFDGEVVVVDEVCYDGMGVHSSSIRELIRQGNIDEANRLIAREILDRGQLDKRAGHRRKGAGCYAKFRYKKLSFAARRRLCDKNEDGLIHLWLRSLL